jgi:hypothetical protein
MNGARDIDVDELFDRNADSRLLERRRSEELGLPPIASRGSTTPARFGPESMVGNVPLAAPRGPMLRVSLDARPNRELIPGAVVTIVAEAGDDGDTDADDVSLRIAIPPESEPIAGSFARDGVELDGEALLGEGLRVGTIPAAGAIRVRFAIRVLPGTEPLDIVAYAHAPGVPAISAPALRLGRRSGHAAYEAPKPFFELEPHEVDEELKTTAAAADSEPVAESAPIVESAPVVEPVAESVPVVELEPVVPREAVPEREATAQRAAVTEPEAATEPASAAAPPPRPEARLDRKQPPQRTIDVVVDEPAAPVVFRTPGPIFGAPPPRRKPTFEPIAPPPFVLPPDVALRQPVSPPEPPLQPAPSPLPLEPQPAAQLQREPEPQVEPQPPAAIEPQPATAIEPQPQAGIEPQRQAEIVSQPVADTQPQPPAKLEPQVELRAEPELSAEREPVVQPVAEPAIPLQLNTAAALPELDVPPVPEIELPAAPESYVLARVLDADEVRALERVFSGAVPHGLAALALLSSVAAAEAPLGRALGVSEFARSIAAALPRALVAARMNRPTPPVVTTDALAAIRPNADAPREGLDYEGALLVARLEPRELAALRTLLARQLEDPFLRGVQVLLAVAPRTVENVAEGPAARLRDALAAYRVAAGAWLMRVSVRRAVDKRYDALTADDPTLHDAGRRLVAALRESVS